MSSNYDSFDSSKRDENFFTYDEAIKFLSIIENDQCYEMFYLILYFALRREELLGLRWSSDDLNRKKMFVEHTVTKGTKVNRSNSTKTETSRREYPLTNEQVTLFKHLKESVKMLIVNCVVTLIKTTIMFLKI